MSVIIVGGGPVGLIASIALSHHGIPHTLFERYPGTSIHPKAVGLNPRTLEVFRSLGLEEAVTAAAAPPHSHSKTAWYTSLGPDRREILTRDAWGGGKYEPEYREFSPCRITVLPQIRLEPILLQRARKLNPGGIVHGAEVVDVKEVGERVEVTVLHGKEEVKTYDASYVIAADGGRTVGKVLGIEMSGDKDVMAMASAHIKAPLSLCHPNPDVLITWFIDPAKGGSINTGYLYHVGPYNGKIEDEEWMFACAINPTDPKKFDEDAMMNRLRETLKIPEELEQKLELLSVSHWLVNAIVADQFRSNGGRVFLAGDAAHRIPPWGALGLNTGIQDVQNLIWKLALALRDGNCDNPTRMNGLLDTYEEERRPVALRVAETSLSNLRNHALAMDRALGIYPTQSAEENVASVNAYFDEEHPDYQKLRNAVLEAQKVLDSEFHAPGAETGWFYPSVNVDDPPSLNLQGQIGENGEFDIYKYHPATSPGRHLPHFWVTRGGVQKSVRDLVRADRFVLFAISTRWNQFKHPAEEIDIEILDGKDGNWFVERDTWSTLPLLNENHALLVRPDGIIAWRMDGIGRVLSTKDFAHVFYQKILHLD